MKEQPSKSERKRLLIEMMKEDEKNGMYLRSAEEILREHTHNVALLDRLTEWHWSFVLKAMDEYASQFKPSAVKTEWISVKERLPESGYYLAIDVWGYITPFIGQYNTVEWRDAASGRWRFPTHWMPLPEPPK